MTPKSLLGALVLTFAGAGSLSAATLTFALKEIGSDVVLTTSGSLSDKTPWTYVTSAADIGGRIGSLHGFIGVMSGDFDVYQATFPAPMGFGSESFYSVSLSYSGDSALIWSENGFLYVPPGYKFGDPLSNTATFSGANFVSGVASFASLGVTDGSYYSWDFGSDKIEIKIGEVGGGGGSAVPETGTTLAGLALALAGLVTLRQRAGRRGAAEA